MKASKSFQNALYPLVKRNLVPCICLKCDSSLNVFYDEKNDYCICQQCVEDESELLEELSRKESEYSDSMPSSKILFI